MFYAAAASSLILVAAQNEWTDNDIKDHFELLKSFAIVKCLPDGWKSPPDTIFDIICYDVKPEGA